MITDREMNLEKIRAAMTQYFVEAEDVWVVESHMLPICVGKNSSLEQATEIFEKKLGQMHAAYLEGKQVWNYKRD